MDAIYIVRRLYLYRNLHMINYGALLIHPKFISYSFYSYLYDVLLYLDI